MPVPDARTTIAKLLAKIWFRSLQSRGTIDTESATLIVLNHPNGLLDALVVSALLDPSPRLVAKSTLWQVAILRPFLAVFDPIPVHRRTDGDASTEATTQTFAAVHTAFTRGDTIAIFPEGISHDRRELAPLKTGAARMLLSAPCDVRLVPAGLVYGERERFRHSALLRIGEPIAFADLRPAGATPDAVNTLTARIKDALIPLTLHGPDDPAQRLAERVAWLLAEGPPERAQLEALRARVRLLAERLRALDEPTRTDIEARALRATNTLADAGVRPDQLGFDYSSEVVARWLPGFLGRLALAPLIVTVGLWFWPVYRITGLVIGRLTLDLDVRGTYKFLLGVVLLPVWLVATLVLAGWAGGYLAVLGAVVAAAIAFVALPMAERVREDVQAIRGFVHRQDPRLQVFVRERAALLEAFPELRAWVEAEP